MDIQRYPGFVETRVALIVDNLVKVNYQACSNTQFYERAEEQGTVFTLKGFEEFLMSGEYNKVTSNLSSTQYVLIRFIDMQIDHDGNITCVDTNNEDKNIQNTTTVGNI